MLPWCCIECIVISECLLYQCGLMATRNDRQHGQPGKDVAKAREQSVLHHVWPTKQHTQTHISTNSFVGL